MFKATIKGRNFRDVQSGTPRVLLTNVMHKGQVFRDHMWLEITPEIRKVLPTSNTAVVNISFEADLVGYRNHITKELKMALARMKNVRRT